MANKVKSPSKNKPANPSDWLAKAHVLSEALPFMQLYDKKTVVVKYGGHAMGDEVLARQFAHDVVLLKQSGINPVIVHGGGPQIAAMLERLNIKSSFKNGLRVTDAQTIEVVEMVLAGAINKQIVTALNAAGGTAVGLSGKDGDLLVAKKPAARPKTRPPMLKKPSISALSARRKRSIAIFSMSCWPRILFPSLPRLRPRPMARPSMSMPIRQPVPLPPPWG